MEVVREREEGERRGGGEGHGEGGDQERVSGVVRRGAKGNEEARRRFKDGLRVRGTWVLSYSVKCWRLLT